ncbi:hypothetical protein SAMN05216207_102516 [Pseudonocardia ammonioxydans]|uniref:Uncharacterized protein n=1 Tax=Pseudonocardia ammonioxydans TaxID=260086 RepID=A0A1I5D4D3_PSUAM|nr:hypothetical protein [Pseudonocardia ammonioxydans]SFN94023.1 hypothetical protein SAMN05216207_102516 [Pseudonocardia ammonioxydans]
MTSDTNNRAVDAGPANADHVNAHVDLRRRALLATRDTAGYLASARALRRREAVAQVHGAVDASVAVSAPADLWLRTSIAITVVGCVLAGFGAVVGVIGLG